MHDLTKLAEAVHQAKQHVEVGGTYTHYRNQEQQYKVLAIGIQEECEEPCVVYQALYGAQLIWVRAVSAWCTSINGSTPRFQLKT